MVHNTIATRIAIVGDRHIADRPPVTPTLAVTIHDLETYTIADTKGWDDVTMKTAKTESAAPTTIGMETMAGMTRDSRDKDREDIRTLVSAIPITKE